MDEIVQAFVRWCARKDAAALIEHTVVEGVLGVAVTAVGQVPAPYAAYAVPLTMAVLTPVIAAIGNGGSPDATTDAVTNPTTAVTSPAPVVTNPTTASTDAASVPAATAGTATATDTTATTDKEA